MITCYLQGGLGNQLFQIFTTIAHAIKNKTKFVFSNTYELNNGSTSRHTYWNSFLSNLRPFLTSINEDIMGHTAIIREASFSYNELPLTTYKPKEYPIKLLVGYFQSPKYFDQYKETIFKIIKLDENKNNIYSKFPLKYENTISLHFRLGDYKKLQDYHPIMSLDYYKKAISYILEKSSLKTILYFCEDEDIEEVEKKIEELKSFFIFDIEFIRGGEGLDDWEQMLQMSLCKYNVIANSTFSWWAAYFNTNNKQIVVYPSVWFGTKAKHDTKDLFPSNWVSV
jgi:hypothetical protein